MNPHPIEIQDDYGGWHRTWEAEGTSDPMNVRRWVEPIAVGRRLLFWRKTVYQTDREGGYWNHKDDVLPPPWRGVEGRRFLRPGVVQLRDDGVPFLGQTIRLLSEIGVGFGWLDALMGLAPRDSHPFTFKGFTPKAPVGPTSTGTR